MHTLTPTIDGVILLPASTDYAEVQTWANRASNFVAPIVTRTKRDGSPVHRARTTSLDGRHAVYFASLNEFKQVLAAMERVEFFKGRKIDLDTWDEDSAFADAICAERAEVVFARDFKVIEPLDVSVEEVEEKD